MAPIARIGRRSSLIGAHYSIGPVSRERRFGGRCRTSKPFTTVKPTFSAVGALPERNYRVAMAVLEVIVDLEGERLPRLVINRI
jgi:hypothetical protein